jgi:hypothetical protein
VSKIPYLEGVPGHRAVFGSGELAALLQEGTQLVPLAWLGLQQCEQSSVDSHQQFLS